MHWEKIATFIPYSWDVGKNMMYIIFHDCLNKFNWFSTKATSTQVYRVFNENRKFQVKNKILLNFPKNHVFFHFFFNCKKSTNYIFSVKDAKCITIIYKKYIKNDIHVP
jgi:hypothetical protein